MFPANAVMKVVPEGNSVFGALLPNPERAIVDIAKLKDHCLDTQHEDGNTRRVCLPLCLGSACVMPIGFTEFLRAVYAQTRARSWRLSIGSRKNDAG